MSKQIFIETHLTRGSEQVIHSIIVHQVNLGRV